MNENYFPEFFYIVTVCYWFTFIMQPAGSIVPLICMSYFFNMYTDEPGLFIKVHTLSRDCRTCVIFFFSFENGMKYFLLVLSSKPL